MKRKNIQHIKLENQNQKIENLEIDIESYSKCATSVSKEIHIESSGKSQLELFGEPKITIGKFTDNATLYKKENNR